MSFGKRYETIFVGLSFLSIIAVFGRIIAPYLFDGKPGQWEIFRIYELNPPLRHRDVVGGV